MRLTTILYNKINSLKVTLQLFHYV